MRRHTLPKRVSSAPVEGTLTGKRLRVRGHHSGNSRPSRSICCRSGPGTEPSILRAITALTNAFACAVMVFTPVGRPVVAKLAQARCAISRKRGAMRMLASDVIQVMPCTDSRAAAVRAIGAEWSAVRLFATPPPGAAGSAAARLWGGNCGCTVTHTILTTDRRGGVEHLSS